jgi:small GTP-binding protein
MESSSKPVISKNMRTLRKRIVNLILIGNIDVGKTAIMMQWHSKEFSDIKTKPTLSFHDMKQKAHIAKDGGEYQVKIWDTAGMERFRTLA